ncbi:MAG: HEAT repeat domain-containing protein [Methanobacteriota archaeon]|nr:MAG: HEAT repeat domain-containing protein [Euryarchaeota archaeon]
MMARSQIDKLVALSFDDDPEVRKKAAIELGKINDAGALLAIAELAYDKNEEVAALAKEILAERKKMEPEMLPFQELFEGVSFAGGKVVKAKDEKAEQKVNKVLEPIYKIFKEKFKNEKKAKRAMDSFVSTLIKDKKPTTQEVLTAYMESIESINPNGDLDIRHMKEELTDIVGNDIKEELIGKEAEDVEKDELFTIEEKKVVEMGSEGSPSIFKMLYDQFMALEGDDKLMKKQLKLFESFFKKQAELAYKIAKKKFKEIKLTDISNIKDGMRGITTDLLEVVDVRHLAYQKTKKKQEVYTRVVLKDEEGKEGVLYLFDGRGKLITKGMMLKLEKAKAKTFKFSQETALTVDKRGRVIVEF